jgi:hypothetical protein
MKLPRLKFLHVTASAAALPVVSRVARGASLPDATSAHCRRAPARPTSRS